MTIQLPFLQNYICFNSQSLVPRGDQGWFCKFCECKMEILEVVNAHLGTCFSMDSTWQVSEYHNHLEVSTFLHFVF